MPDERRLRLKTLFAEVLALSPERRDAFLAERCAGDEAMGEDVRSLVEAHEAAGRFIETPAAAAVAPQARPPDICGVSVEPASQDGQVVGAYRIEKEIGSGGMGTVYLAARADGAFDRQVALKIVRQGARTGEILQRFRHERQTLANLDHPNIARLLDAGSTEDGLPFLVMEHVEGVPIDQYCDEKKLGVHARLDLFRTLALAVDAAHRNLVVHRDLKPQNVLVTGEGQVKLLDFGVAKVLSPHPGSPETREGWRLLTPEYASPEQILGGPITTATDVFSLGVLLYELLTGRHPFRKPFADERATERQVCEGLLAPPSSIVLTPCEREAADGSCEVVPAAVLSAKRNASPADLSPQLAGDLDAIVAMAVRKEPDRRYSSAGQLAEDVSRCQAALPVLARRGALTYRAGKFARRNAAAVAGAALFLIVLAAGVAGVAWQARAAAFERDRARIEAGKAQQVSLFLQDMLRSADPARSGRAVTVVDMLDRAARRLESERNVHPEVAAGIRRALGVTYSGLGVYDAAEVHLRAALAAMPLRSPGEQAEAAAVECELANVVSSNGDIVSAEGIYRRALATFDALGLAGDLRRAEALNGLGEVLRSKGDTHESEARHKEALEVRRRRLGNEDILVAESLNNVAVVLHERNDLAGAERLYRESLAIVRKLRGDDHPGVPATLTNLATVVGSRGNMAEGERLYREALAIRRRLLGESHPDVAFTLYALADALFSLGRHDEAVATCRDVLDRRGPSLPPGHPVIAATWLILGKTLLERGELREAETAMRNALEIRRTFLPAGHWQIASAESALARCLVRQGRFREAEPMALQAYERLHEDRGPAHERTADALSAVVDMYERWRKPEKAAEYSARR